MTKKKVLFEEINDDFRLEKLRAGDPGLIVPGAVDCDNCCGGTWSTTASNVDACCQEMGESIA